MRFRLLMLLYWLTACTNPDEMESYDICVYGGTSAGVIAAYAAARMGKTVILIEPGRRLGGLTSGGLGYTDIGNKYAISGIARDFYRKIGKHYGKFEQWIFEPHVAMELFEAYIKLGHVHVLYEYRLAQAEMQDGSIHSLMLESSSGTGEKKSISAKMFVDCTYEGDLMAKAGVAYTVGRESNSTYGETYNGVQLMEGHQFPDGVDPYRTPGDAASGLLWGISDASLDPAGTGDGKVQAYNFRICLTDDSTNRIPVTRPSGYDSTRYELLLRLIEAQPGKRTLNDYMIVSRMPNRKTDINNRGGFSTDMIGMNYDYPEATYEERAEIISAHKEYTKGLLYFLGNDPRVPEPLRRETSELGYPKDEYTENGNWTPQMYIRECRRVIGSYVMTQANCEGRVTVDDGVGMAAYTMDSHNCQRLIVSGMVKNEGNVEIGGFGPYPISYRALIPGEDECKNLLVPVCLSASHIAYGSIRMEPVFMVLAQSAAIAASLAIDSHQPVQEVNADTLRQILNSNPLLDGSPPDVLVDDNDSLHVEISGLWESRTRGGYGPTYLVSQSARSSVTYSPDIPRPGRYDLYAYIPVVTGSSATTHFVIQNGRIATEKNILTSEVQVEGQTSGEWVPLGSYELASGRTCSVTVSRKEALGSMVADAILFTPIP